MLSEFHEKVSNSFKKRSALPRWWKRNWEVSPPNPIPWNFFLPASQRDSSCHPRSGESLTRRIDTFSPVKWECGAASRPVYFFCFRHGAHGEPEKDILQPRKVNVLRPLAQLLMEMEEEPPPGPEGTSTGITALSVKPGSSSSFCGWKSRIPPTNVFIHYNFILSP